MPFKSICLISRSSYPYPISRHTQNMQTFDGWSRFWDNVVILAQCGSNKRQVSEHKRVYGVLLPLISNRYLNIMYFTFFGIFEINKLFKKYNFEIFQASDAGGAVLALIASKIYKRHFIFEIQGDIFDYPSEDGNKIHSKLVKLFSRFLAKQADYIRIVSPFLYVPLDKLNIDRKKIFLVPPRCDSKLFNKKNVNNIKPKEFNGSSFNLLFVGNIISAKGVDILLEAFALINKENPDIGLIFLGEGHEKENLIRRAEKLCLNNKVKFVGRVEYSLIPTFMHYSDILILPSIEEGVGRVLLEAMAMKLPIIASKTGGIPLVINENEDGLLFKVGDIIALKRHVMLLISDPKFAASLSKIGYKKFLTTYEYDVSMKIFIDMYKAILD